MGNWACIEKGRRIRRQESDGGAGERKERKNKIGGGRTTSRTNCRRELSGEEAQDRTKWRRLIRHIDSTSKWERMRKKKK